MVAIGVVTRSSFFLFSDCTGILVDSFLINTQLYENKIQKVDLNVRLHCPVKYDKFRIRIETTPTYNLKPANAEIFSPPMYVSSS